MNQEKNKILNVQPHSDEAEQAQRPPGLVNRLTGRRTNQAARRQQFPFSESETDAGEY